MFTTICGVDFSGAKLAGHNTWLARLEADAGRPGQPRYRLAELACLEKLAGTAEREPALAHLVKRIAASDGALWALDFPFGLPVEVLAPDPFAFLAAWGEDAYAAGLECLRRADAHPPAHRRRGVCSVRLLPLPDHLANALRPLARPRSVRSWALTTLCEKLVTIGAKVVRQAKYIGSS
jgi:hypothetical protein